MQSHKGSAVSLLLILIIAFLSGIVAAEGTGAVRLISTIPVPGVKGRIDHMAFDPTGNRLFVAALGNDSVEVIDLKEGKRVKSIHGLRAPQDVLVVPEQHLLFVANGGDGMLSIFNDASFVLLKTIRFPSDADNLRYEGLSGRVYVGYGNGGIGVVDARNLERAGDVALPGHPESFQIETRGARIFVNVPSAGKIVVIDKDRKAAIAEWPVPGSCSNFPMALDENGNHLFIGCRHPARVLVLDTGSGKQVAEFPIADDADDIYFDSVRQRIYVSCGAGVLQIFQQTAAGSFTSKETIPTGPGARTSLFVPEHSRFYVAAPLTGQKPAVIQLFSVQP